MAAAAALKGCHGCSIVLHMFSDLQGFFKQARLLLNT
jgi:hypothetical protein